MSLETILITANSVAAVVVIWSSICAANQMNRKTRLLLRLSYILLGVGAAASLFAPGYFSRPPTLAEVLLIMGIATFSLANKRRKERVFTQPI